MRIEEVMTRDVASCTPDTSMREAARMMWQHDCGSLPVTSNDGSHAVVGMITDRDICMAACHEGKTLDELQVERAMARELVVCHPEDDVRSVEDKMQQAQVRRLPVVDRENHLSGFITLAKIARLAGDGRKGVRADQVGTTLAGISQPRRESSAVQD